MSSVLSHQGLSVVKSEIMVLKLRRLVTLSYLYLCNFAVTNALTVSVLFAYEMISLQSHNELFLAGLMSIIMVNGCLQLSCVPSQSNMGFLVPWRP